MTADETPHTEHPIDLPAIIARIALALVITLILLNLARAAIRGYLRRIES